MVITLGQQYNVGEKPTVILYTYINRHAGTPTKSQHMRIDKAGETVQHRSIRVGFDIYYYAGVVFNTPLSSFVYILHVCSVLCGVVCV